MRVKKFWRVGQVAEFLGVHERTVYDWAAAGQIPSIRLGRSLFFDPEAICNLGKTNRNDTSQTAQATAPEPAKLVEASA